MKKIKAFVSQHQLVTLIGALILLFAIAKGASWYSQYQAQKKFEREHPLVNKVYKFYDKEKPAAGGTEVTTGYFVFGNDQYRNKVVTVYSDYGGMKEVRKMLHDKSYYKKEFEDEGEADEYVVKDGNKLEINGEGADYQVKKGKSWVGLYQSNGKNDEVPGEVHKTTPISVN